MAPKPLACHIGHLNSDPQQYELDLRLAGARSWYYDFFRVAASRLLGEYCSRATLDYEFSAVDLYGDYVSLLERKARIIR